ncbi:MAG: hypothetical protein HY360_07900 [Verrucomicrobia bacterium]|nr:hypothetical protein [Verrucomicrobiota bacterium]
MTAVRRFSMFNPIGIALAWLGLVFLPVAPASAAAKAASETPQEEVIQFQGSSASDKEAGKKTASTNTVSKVGYKAFSDTFIGEYELIVPLGEVVLLVVLVNIFALFKKARIIMATSYLFCFKWVFWSNYTQLLQQSNAVMITCGYIFVICGIFTAVLFCIDRFSFRD